MPYHLALAPAHTILELNNHRALLWFYLAAATHAAHAAINLNLQFVLHGDQYPHVNIIFNNQLRDLSSKFTQTAKAGL